MKLDLKCLNTLNADLDSSFSSIDSLFKNISWGDSVGQSFEAFNKELHNEINKIKDIGNELKEIEKELEEVDIDSLQAECDSLMASI